MKRIYLDSASATHLSPEVKRKIRKIEDEIFGNPSAIHQEGLKAKKYLEEARKKISVNMQVKPEEIIFTSSGTEGNNLAIKGSAEYWFQKKKKPGRIIISSLEHKSIKEPAATLATKGWDICQVPVDEDGQIILTELEKLINSQTCLISIGYVNSEIGSIQNLRAICQLIKKFKKKDNFPYFHSDACQAGRFLPLVPNEYSLDLMTINGSKIYGPEGSGLLFKKRSTKILPILSGGGQENNLRAGTENVAAAIGLAEALDLVQKQRKEKNDYLTSWRDYLSSEIFKNIPAVKINGGNKKRVANNLNISFKGLSGEFLVLSLDAEGIACSTGSACNSSEEVSPVLIALGLSIQEASAAIRFSLDRDISKKDIDYVIKKLISSVKLLREHNY